MIDWPKLNLRSTKETTPWIRLGRRHRITIDVQASAWGSAVAELKWTALPEGEGAQSRSFETAITFDSTTPARRNISVSGVGAVRLEVTTADATADGAAQVVHRDES